MGNSQELVENIEEKTKEIPTYIRLFFEKRMIWENKDCYRFLTPRQFKIALFILRRLQEKQPCSQQALFELVRNDFKEFVDCEINKCQGLPSKIKESENKWIIKKKRNNMEYKKTILRNSLNATLHSMISFFIYRKQIWDKTGKRPGAYILMLNRRGKKIVERLYELEDTKIKETKVV